MRRRDLAKAEEAHRKAHFIISGFPARKPPSSSEKIALVRLKSL